MLGRGRACQERGQEFTSGWKRSPHRASPTEAEFCLFGPRLSKDSAWHVADSHWTARRGDEGTSNSPGHREKRLQRRQREETDGAGCSQGARGRRRPWPWSRGPRTAGGDTARAVHCRSASQAPREGAVGVGLAGPRTRARPQPRTPQSSRAAQGLGLASGREAGGVCKASPGHTHPKATQTGAKPGGGQQTSVRRQEEATCALDRVCPWTPSASLCKMAAPQPVGFLESQMS